MADLRRVFGDRLIAVATYGPHAEHAGHGSPVTCLALVRTLGRADLDACARASHAWHRHGAATPLILPEAEFRGSLDAFPLEYGEILRAHVCIYGLDPFADAAIPPKDLRRACETQVRSHLVHLRQDFIETSGKPRDIGELVRGSAAAFAALLRNVARLHGAIPADRDAATREGARIAGLSDTVVAAILALEQPKSVASTDAARIFPEYLATVEQLATFVDNWGA